MPQDISICLWTFPAVIDETTTVEYPSFAKT